MSFLARLAVLFLLLLGMILLLELLLPDKASIIIFAVFLAGALLLFGAIGRAINPQREWAEWTMLLFAGLLLGTLFGTALGMASWPAAEISLAALAALLASLVDWTLRKYSVFL